MSLIEDSDFNHKMHNLPSSQLPQLQPLKRSKFKDFLKELYSYPPKFTIKWNSLDELKGDLLFKHNYGVLEHSIPFVDFFEDWFFSGSGLEESFSKKYSFNDYLNGYLDKINTSNFYKEKTKDIQLALSTIPTFVVLNGQKEIVLNKPIDMNSSNNVGAFVNKYSYNYCGAFDSAFKTKTKTGLFFFNLEDAKIYLQEVAKIDKEGTNTLGLSIHCIGLDVAYRITREDHPEIDFRFVPDFQEVKNLLATHMGKSDGIVEDEQQQLRFRRRTVNLFPYLEKLGKLISISNAFLLNNEYFKGVPIYVVQVSDNPRDLLKETYYITLGVLDNIYAKFMQSIDSKIGHGHNWLMQGSIRDASNNKNLTNYVFFNKEEALKFVRSKARLVNRYKGSRTSNVSFIIKKPKIYIYNLEDYIEFWEETINQKLSTGDKRVTDTVFDAKDTYFISQKSDTYKINQNAQELIVNSIEQTLLVKWRVLKQFVGLVFNMA